MYVCSPYWMKNEILHVVFSFLHLLVFMSAGYLFELVNRPQTTDGIESLYKFFTFIFLPEDFLELKTTD